jgi:hypothetical protein
VANAHMPDDFYDLVCHHLPPEKPVGPEGGRPRIRHRVVLKVIWFVLVSGCRWEDVPLEMGCFGSYGASPLAKLGGTGHLEPLARRPAAFAATGR